MSTPDKTYTPDETYAALEAIAKATGDDNFWIRIVRRSGVLATDVVARLEQAQLNHVAKPETWIPVLCGGGTFVMTVGHASDEARNIGGPLIAQFKDEVRPVDLTVVGAPGWNGPKKITYPDPYAAGQPSYYRSPHGRPVGATPRNDVPPPGGSWGGYDDGGRAGGRDGEAIAALRRELDAERKARDERERQIREERERERADARTREQEARYMAELHDMKTKMEAMQAQVQARPTGGMDLVGLAGVIAPLLKAMVDNQNALRLEQMKLAASASDGQRDFFKAITSRPAVDPTLQAALDKMERAIEKAKEESGGAAETMDAMTNAMHTMTKIAMQSAQAVAETSLKTRAGEEEPTGLKAFKEGMKALENIFGAWGKSGGAAGATATDARRKLPGATGVNGANGAIQKPGEKPGEPPDEVTQVVNAIRAERDVEEVATVIVKLAAAENPSFVKAMEGVRGNLNQLALDRLGTNWIFAHQEYVTRLLKAVERLGEGMFGAKPAGQEQDGREAEGEEEAKDG